MTPFMLLQEQMSSLYIHENFPTFSIVFFEDLLILYIKENIYISENDSENLTNVLKTKTANETGIIKLYIALFEKFDIYYTVYHKLV